MNEYYTQYLHQFYVLLSERSNSRSRRSKEMISSELTLWQPVSDNQGRRYRMIGIRPEDSILQEQKKWAHIGRYPVCLFPAGSYEKFNYYAIPAQVNGKDCDIIVSISKRTGGETPESNILGSRYDDGLVKQKGYDPLAPGDKIAFYYLERDFDSRNTGDWHLTPEILVDEIEEIKSPHQLQWKELSGEFYTSLKQTDVYQDIHFGTLIPLGI